MGLSAKVEDTTNLDKALEMIRQGAVNGLYIATNIVHAEAVKTSPIAPILGGTLRMSHSMQINEEELYGEVYIPENSPAAEYAPIVELTEPPMHPSNSGSRIPWLRPALYDNQNNCYNAIKKEVEKEIK
jgi:hypothetical protein